MRKTTQCLTIANQVHPRLLITLAIKLHLTHLLIPPDYSLYQLWHKFGLDKHHDLDVRLEVLHQWVSILYGQNIDLHVLVKKLRKERSEAYQGVSKAGGCLLFGDIVEDMIQCELYHTLLSCPAYP